MKIQLMILGLFIVATLAHRHRDEDEGSQVGRRRHFRGSRRNDNQIAANAEDAEMEDAISSEDETATEGERSGRRGCGRGSRRGERRGGHRHHQSEHDLDTHQRHGDRENEDERKPFAHNSEWHEKHGVPMPDENSESERKHHRHHHHHHHHRHHHRNQTTTTTTTTESPTTNDPNIDFNPRINDENENTIDDFNGAVDRDP